MLIERLCSPALIYLAFSIMQLVLDMSQGKFKLAIAKLFICLMFTYLLNVLCDQKLTNLSWIIISLPFLFMGYLSLLLVYALGFSDINGNDINNSKNKETTINDTSSPETEESVEPADEVLSVTAFEPVKGNIKNRLSDKKNPVQSTGKKADNLNIDALKLENGKV